LEAKAVEKYLRMSSSKVKYVIDLVKNKPVEEAMDLLTFTTRGAASVVKKAIQSAASNAVENFKEYKVTEGDLFIKEIYANEGPTLKRFKARARGRADKIFKRTSHITVLVSDGKKKKQAEKTGSKAASKKEAKN
jgi:large subunit ribosomal protein L22